MEAFAMSMVFVLFWGGFYLGRLSLRREILYLRNYKENRERLERIERAMRA